MASPDLQALTKEIIRIGVVKSTNPEKCTARVEIPDMDNSRGQCLRSYDLKVGQQKTREDKRYWMPDVDERVLCLFFGNGPSYGVILCSWYWEEDTPPVNCQDKDHTRYKDGSVLEYDRAAHTLTADIQGDVVVKATGNVTVEAAGNVKVTGARIDLN